MFLHVLDLFALIFTLNTETMAIFFKIINLTTRYALRSNWIFCVEFNHFRLNRLLRVTLSLEFLKWN